MPYQSLAMLERGKASSSDIKARIVVNAYTGRGIFQSTQKRMLQLLQTIASQNIFPGQTPASSQSKESGVSNNAPT